METIDREYYGLISEKTSERDWQLLAGVVDLPQPRHDYWSNQIQYNQKEVAYNSCSIHGAIGAVSSLANHIFSIEDRKFIWELALARGADPKIGWYLNEAVDLVREWANDNLNEEFVSFKVALDSQEFADSLKKGYRAVVGFRGNGKYSKDKGDGVLDQTKLDGKYTYGHCVGMVISQDPNYAEVIIDNYAGSGSFNSYKIPLDHLKDLVANGVFFYDGYFFAYKADMQSEPSLISSFAVNSVAKAKEKGITKWDKPQEALSPELCSAMLFKAGVITSDAPMTKERFAIVLDRLKAI